MVSSRDTILPASTPGANHPRPTDGEIAVSSTQAQREIFSASVMDPDASLGYNHSITIFFKGPLDVDAIYSTLLNLVDRHEALRGHFSDDGLRFMVRAEPSLEMPLIDLSGEAEATRQRHYEAFLDRELAHVFDLVNGPLFRGTLVKVSSASWALVLNCHHAIVDGWSLKIILDDLPKLYNALVRGEERAALEDPPSLLEYLRSAVRREQDMAHSVRTYWKNLYADGTPLLNLPIDYPRPRDRSYRSRRNDYRLERGVYQRLVQVGAGLGISQFVTLLSALALFLHRLSGQDDLIVGVPAAGQIAAGKPALLCHDARVMPIRCVLHAQDSFATYARRVMDAFLSAYEHQWISMPELIRELNAPIDPTRVPMMPVMFNFDPGMKRESFRFEGLDAHHCFNPRKAETFEMSVNAVVEDADLVLEWVYNTSLFDDGEMQRRLEQFQCLLRSIGESPALPANQLSMVPTEQIQAMERALNSNTMPYERELCVDALIERAVAASPDKVAVEYGAMTATYRQIWERAGNIASAILSLNLGAKPLVGVMLDRNAAMIEVLLGVWRCGGAFLPLDPSYPLERLQYMIDHSKVRVVLTEGEIHRARELQGVEILDAETIAATSTAPAAPPAGRSSEDRAYVIYTSGSSGKPKGVQVPHRALHNVIQSMRTQAPGLTAANRVLGITTIAFDIAQLELWLPLVSGATVVLADRGTAIDGDALGRLIRERQVDFVQATPATWRVLLLAGWRGEARITALCGGEALPRDLAEQLLTRVGSLWNVYGPTETTVWSTIDRVDDGQVSIGRPIGNTQAYVLDAALQWVARGSIGELWIGGDGVSLGYFGRDDLTRERFQPNPFTGRGHMYRTGDLVRLRRDGRLEYVGRNDAQVKVRGYRIELGDVEHALAKHPSIQQCVVAVKEKAPGDAYLVGYFTPRRGTQPSSADLRQALRTRLPEYMVPGVFVALDAWPLTQNGKIDRNALPDPFAPGLAAPGKPTEPRADLARAESLLGEHPGIECAALVVPNAGSADVRPIAFLVPRRGAEPDLVQVRKHLRPQVAESLIPGRVVLVERLPVAADGRTDRRALLAGIGIEEVSDTALEPADVPRTDAERLLADTWREVLSVHRVGLRDNFFHLGGNSLQSIQMIVRVEKRTGHRLNPRLVIFNSLEQLARELTPHAPMGATA